MNTAVIDKTPYIGLLEKYFETELASEIIKYPLFEFPAQMQLGKENDKIDIVPLVVKGSIRAIRHDISGKEILIYNIAPGQSCILTITAAMRNADSKVVAISNEETAIFAISQEKAAEWLKKYDSWRTFVVELYEQRLNELVENHGIVTDQKNKIFKQSKEITDSINYAQRIQQAALPPDELITSLLPENFIFYQPKNIVSGDYYWLSQVDNKTVLAVADCTGHGVPGAFMSMLGISFLNQLANNSSIHHPNEILEEMRKNVKNSLRQESENSDLKDGMDMVLIIFDKDTYKMEYSGAYNPVYIIHDNQLIETQPDKMPIGIHMKKDEGFTNHVYQLYKGDVLYAFSDGYIDQFGGENNRKFMTRQFKELLLNIHNLPMNEQKVIIQNTFENWKGNREQIDDVLVMGMRV